MPKKGYKQSEEHKRKKAEARKGKPCSQLTKMKISLTLKQRFRQRELNDIKELKDAFPTYSYQEVLS